MRIAVVGAGILGLACGRAILERAPDCELVVLDKEPEVARHQTGHNSGVVHAGLYYEPGSLKARLCRRGAGLLRDYCARHGLPYEECGQVLVATTEPELARLERILARAQANGVPGVRLIDAAELRLVEPHVAGIGALRSPTSAIVDYAAVARALAAGLRAAGARLELGVRVLAVRDQEGGPELELAGAGRRGVGPGAASAGRRGAGSGAVGGAGRLGADRVLVCAGLESDRLARASGLSGEPRIVPFRGEYWALVSHRRHLVRGLVYPVPDPALPFLGVHLTRTVHGQVLVGPNAILALSREGYRRTDLDVAEIARTLAYPGMRRLAARHWRVALAELGRSLSRRAFVAAARRYVPELRSADVVAALAGVRAQALRASGQLLDDFALDRTRHVVWVRNAPSPGATSALALAEELVDRLGL